MEILTLTTDGMRRFNAPKIYDDDKALCLEMVTLEAGKLHR